MMNVIVKVQDGVVNRAIQHPMPELPGPYPGIDYVKIAPGIRPLTEGKKP